MDYNQKIIESYDEKYIKKLISKIRVEDIKNNYQSFQWQKIYVVLQNYLAKKIINNNISEKEQILINTFYKDIYNSPYKYVDSPLLKNNIIDKVFKDKKDIVKKFRNNYYSPQQAKKYYIESKKRELTEYEKNQYYAYLIKYINTSNKELQEVIKNEVMKIIDSNKKISELNKMELKFYAKYLTTRINFKNSHPQIIIGEDRKSLWGQAGNDTICINQNAENYDITRFTQTVFHEARHIIQEENIDDQNKTEGFEMAQRRLFSKYLNTDDYDSYHDNYRYSKIELDAESMGYYHARLFFHTIKRYDLEDKIYADEEKYLDNRDDYHFMLDDRKVPVPVDKFIVDNMNKIIKEHKEELDNYPVLKRFYDSNGNVKSFVEIMNQRMHGVEYKGMIEYYINHGIMNDELDRIDLKNSSKQAINNFTNTFGSMYRDKMCTINRYLADDETYEKHNKSEKAKKIISNTTGYELVLATKMLTFIEKNFDIIIETSDEKISNTHPMFSFIYDFTDFNPDNIKNVALKDNPVFYSKLKNFITVYNKVLKRFNREYIRQRLNNLSEENKNITITIDNKKMTLETFLNSYVSKMDGHQHINLGNKKINVSNLLYELSKNKKDELNAMLNELEEQNNNLDKNNIMGG